MSSRNPIAAEVAVRAIEDFRFCFTALPIFRNGNLPAQSHHPRVLRLTPGLFGIASLLQHRLDFLGLPLLFFFFFTLLAILLICIRVLLILRLLVFLVFALLAFFFL